VGGNRPRAEALLARLGAAPPPGPLRFPAGSIYWARAELLAKLAQLRLEPADFEGTTAHTVERLMGWLAVVAGQKVCTAKALDAPGLDKPGKLGQ